LIIGHSQFIKTVDDLYEALAGNSPRGESIGKMLVKVGPAEDF
jgi:adenosine/AMP kinase